MVHLRGVLAGWRPAVLGGRRRATMLQAPTCRRQGNGGNSANSGPAVIHTCHQPLPSQKGTDLWDAALSCAGINTGASRRCISSYPRLCSKCTLACTFLVSPALKSIKSPCAICLCRLTWHMAVGSWGRSWTRTCAGTASSRRCAPWPCCPCMCCTAG